ncbi:alpha/beta hydrolase family esterase [Sphingomonas canadensis]|uniref:Alpha/beta hydrolase family esterase n=1 Tax=Sphingomonas canadensis TaxID=1219257 RepID=A0ABW3HA97_9SPHN|nr:alpha/beta hydrolase-fold protein [Sphingomonas canadensis]MCW3836990.1 alpha/beta hydrolase-fold protein [Sphingomonas canadensis]
MASWSRWKRTGGAAGALIAALTFTAAPAAGQAAGQDLRLTYAMAQAGGEQIPYRVYLPAGWTPERRWPLVVVLHGYGGTADAPFTDAGGKLQQEAEKHGFVVVSPNGYNGMADYGANLPLPRTLGRGNKPLAMTPQAESALAEADVLNVLARAKADYSIDPQRIYLMGNSMGMTGVLHFARKMPDSWCAISPSDGPPWRDYPVEALRTISGVLFVNGGKDDIAKPADIEALAARAKAAGVNARVHIVPEGTHASAWVDYLTETFAFFAASDCAR